MQMFSQVQASTAKGTGLKHESNLLVLLRIDCYVFTKCFDYKDFVISVLTKQNKQSESLIKK